MLRYRIYAYKYGFAATMLRLAAARLPSAWRRLAVALTELPLRAAPAVPQ